MTNSAVRARSSSDVDRRRTMMSAISILSLGAVFFALTISNGAAQEKCRLSWEVPASDTKYTQQFALDVGDIPGHQIRIYELHRVYPNDKPNCEGLKRIESWSYGYSDYVNRNGPYHVYMVTTLENGDKIFSESTGTSQTALAEDGSKKSSTEEGTEIWTGGTGKYKGVHGFQWSHGVFDIDKGLNQRRSEAEYWFDE
jgi:hypothetical protein